MNDAMKNDANHSWLRWCLGYDLERIDGTPVTSSDRFLHVGMHAVLPILVVVQLVRMVLDLTGLVPDHGYIPDWW